MVEFHHLRRASPISRRSRIPPVFRSIFDPLFGAEDRRWGVLRSSGTKIEDLSNKNPNKLQAGQDGAAHDGTAGEARTGRTGRRRAGSIEDRSLSYPPGVRRQISWACLWKYEQEKSYVNRWKNTNQRMTIGL